MTPNSGLLRLPNELIIQIAKSFLQDTDPFEEQKEAPTTPLRCLCLTCRHLLPIAQLGSFLTLPLKMCIQPSLFMRTLKENSTSATTLSNVNTSRPWKILDASTRNSHEERRVLEQIKKSTRCHAGHQACTFGLWPGFTEGHVTSSPNICTCNLCRYSITQLGRLDPIEFNKRYSALHVAYAMLFCMLPNVRRLKFLVHEISPCDEDHSRDPDGFGEAFLNEILANLLKSSDTRSLVLPRLKIATFTLDSPPNEWGRAILSTFFLPSLLTLPSLRQLVGRLDINPGAVGPFTATQAPAFGTFFTLD
ncbi:predicted protein [Verticillium alfalfae VaMs.102]|uniref:Predicted protein n=1 Tax=Verticillium alfalfae (strain VaMs.102 / ATCC MYA-4576 / FGSC 10136) TaxID=526221 RepID=C9SXP0_VERA1|nr:predicted protein [Verticillium alfalfae VaMs.102]EEY23430.1 predicted protein [Verticillium alfalfae VaMs.102]